MRHKVRDYNVFCFTANAVFYTDNNQFLSCRDGTKYPWVKPTDNENFLFPMN